MNVKNINPLYYLRLIVNYLKRLTFIELFLVSCLFRTRPCRPGPVGYLFQKEGNGDMGTLKLVFTESSASDVVTGGQRELTYQINQGSPIVQTLPGAAIESELITCELNDRVSGTLVDIDSSGNRSEVGRDFDLLIDRDNVAPATPGEVGFEFNADTNAPVSPE